MQEYLKAEKRMIDKGFQLTSDGVLRRIFKDLSYLLTFIFVFTFTFTFAFTFALTFTFPMLHWLNIFQCRGNRLPEAASPT